MERKDGLPHPATAEELYLAAILDELRGMRQDAAATVEVSGAPIEKAILHVKEPEKSTTSKNRR